MTTTLRFLGHASFEIKTDDHTILIDPFLTGNPQAACAADDLAADAILITHGHEDHVGDVEAIAKRTGALVVANFEIHNWFQARGVENAHPMHIGGKREFDFGTVQLTIAHHGSSMPDGSYGGSPAGILLTTKDGTIYHAGDTALFLDMQLIGEAGIDAAILPIGDNFTMGPNDSVKAVQWLKPGHVIPAHYNTWPVIEQDAAAWSNSVRTETEATPLVLESGQSWTLSTC